MKSSIHFLTAFILLVSSTSIAQVEASFQRANKAYNDGNYQLAIDGYQQVLQANKQSEALYFNLGNAHYKLNNIAESIYYYEKAQQLNPGDEEIENNLAFAQNARIDQIEDLPVNELSQGFSKLTHAMTATQWGILAIVFMGIAVLVWALLFLPERSPKKKMGTVLSMLSIMIAILAVVMGSLSLSQKQNSNYAIVFKEETNVRAEPNDRAEQVFQLHEGTKVNVAETVGEWTKITLANGNIGWITTSHIKQL